MVTLVREIRRPGALTTFKHSNPFFRYDFAHNDGRQFYTSPHWYVLANDGVIWKQSLNLPILYILVLLLSGRRRWYHRR